MSKVKALFYERVQKLEFFSHLVFSSVKRLKKTFFYYIIKPMEVSYYISVAIKKFLTERGMRSYTLAALSGCNKTAVNSWLYQRQMPSSKGLMRLADYMNVSMDYMLGLKADPRIIRSGTTEKFARRIKLLTDGSVTSYRLAKECRLGTSAVSKWKDMERLPKLEVLIKLSSLFGVTVDWLVGRTNIPD